MTFSEKLTILRKRRGLSQEQLAEMLDVSRQSVSKWEAQQALPETAKIVMISDIFQVPIDLLLKDSQMIETEDAINGILKQKQETIVESNILVCAKCRRTQPAGSAFCGNCGNPLTQNTQPVVQKPQNECPQNESQQQVSKDAAKKRSKIRTGMKTGMIICFVVAGVYCLMAIMKMQCLAATAFFGMLGLMFLGLGLSTKENKYVFGKVKGLKKGAFIALCIIGAFVAFGAIALVVNPSSILGERPETSQIQPEKTGEENADNNLTGVAPEKTTLEDVRVWYDNQTAAVSQSLMDYANSVDGLSALNVDSSKFRFGEEDGWYDCHYTFQFSCKINGVNHIGEARAFVKYQDSTVNWFHFEIFSNEDIQSVVEHYDDSYDEIIEEYYKELKKQFDN